VVNGTRVTIPSYSVKVGDVIKIREGSQKTKLFVTLEEKLQKYTSPSWLSYSLESKEGKVQGVPKLTQGDILFDPKAVLEFYSR
jgi:small subunit ribosomal protein S4